MVYKMTIVSCQICSKNFYSKPSWIKLGFGKYCSLDCKRVGQKTGKLVKCFLCNKEVYKSGKALKQSKSGKFFCGKSCQTRWRNGQYVGLMHKNYIDGNSSYKTILNRSGGLKICTLCKTDDKRVLAVHHIDGNHRNNDVKNLSWLCHNCHHLVHHDKVEGVRFKNLLKI